MSFIDVAQRLAVRYAAPELQGGSLRQLANGVATAHQQISAYKDFWAEHNQRALAATGPLWVVLGDSTAQGIGASDPMRGYVGQVHAELTARTGQPWRVLNLSVSGATSLDVLNDQLPQLDGLGDAPQLVTCSVGGNDLSDLSPRVVHRTFRALIAALPDCAMIFDLPVPVGLYWGIGRAVSPYVAGVNTTIRAAAARRGISVVAYSRSYTRPWRGKFAADRFHPSDRGYRDATRAVLEELGYA